MVYTYLEGDELPNIGEFYVSQHREEFLVKKDYDVYDIFRSNGEFVRRVSLDKLLSFPKVEFYIKKNSNIICY